MKYFLTPLLVLLFVMGSVGLSADQRQEIDDAIELINSRLSYSAILRIDSEGVVRIKAPDQVIEFPIQEVSFNYNDNDSRLRVIGEFNIKYFEDGKQTETSHRQSFSCKSKRMAYDAIEAFRKIKQLFVAQMPRQPLMERPLPMQDKGLGYGTMQEAMDFINENLTVSAIVGVNEQGVMTVNAPAAIYKIDLKKAEFGLNDWEDGSRVRIYGDWCMQIIEEGDQEDARYLPRESFSSHSTSRARQSVRALYYIKGAVTGQKATQIEENRNLKEQRRENYASIEEAIEYINDRLEISIIFGINDKGIMTVNASEYVYKLPIRDCRFRQGRNHISLFGWGILGGRSKAVQISSPKGLECYEDREYDKTVSDESFSVRSKSAVKEVIEAFEYIQNKMKI